MLVDIFFVKVDIAGTTTKNGVKFSIEDTPSLLPSRNSISLILQKNCLSNYPIVSISSTKNYSEFSVSLRPSKWFQLVTYKESYFRK